MDKITQITTRLLLVTMILTALVAMTVFVSRTEQLLSVHARYWVYAIPAAISETVHGAHGFVIFDAPHVQPEHSDRDQAIPRVPLQISPAPLPCVREH